MSVVYLSSITSDRENKKADREHKMDKPQIFFVVCLIHEVGNKNQKQ